MGSGGGSSSSGEEDGDAEWRAAIESVAATNFSLPVSKASTINSISSSIPVEEDEEEKKPNSHVFKLYQIKAQKLLDDLLDKNLVMVNNPTPALEENHDVRGEGGIRLFSQAPPGIMFDPVDVYPRPTKRPRILPTEEVSEKSKKFQFRRQILSVAVDGSDVIAAAKNACQQSLARFEAKEVAAKAAVKREEERVAELKRIRGEKWLPSIARDMQVLRSVESKNKL